MKDIIYSKPTITTYTLDAYRLRKIRRRFRNKTCAVIHEYINKKGEVGSVAIPMVGSIDECAAYVYMFAIDSDATRAGWVNFDLSFVSVIDGQDGTDRFTIKAFDKVSSHALLGSIVDRDGVVQHSNRIVVRRLCGIPENIE